MSERTVESLTQRVRDSAPLDQRLQEAGNRIGKMCSEHRGPRMTIPVQWYDDDFFISVTLRDARDALLTMQRERDEAKAALKIATQLNDEATWKAEVAIKGLRIAALEGQLAASERTCAELRAKLDVYARAVSATDAIYLLHAEIDKLRARAEAAERTVEGLMERADVEVCCAQAVEFAEYVTEHAKGKMVEAAQRFLSLPYSRELAAKLKRGAA